MPILSEKDIEAIRTFGKDHKIHFVSLSYCRSAEDVRDCRSFLDRYTKPKSKREEAVFRVGLTSTQIIAKIENVKALKNFASILNAADGIMFSRGYIGLDIASEKIFRVQKYIIDVNHTQSVLFRHSMLLGMQSCMQTHHCHACIGYYDGKSSSDACRSDGHCKSRFEWCGLLHSWFCPLRKRKGNGLSLGAETFRGKHPVATIQLIQAISKQAEKTFDSELFSSAMSEEALSHNISEHEKVRCTLCLLHA